LGEELKPTRRQILDLLGHKIGWLSFDAEEGKEFRWEKGVVVGKLRQESFYHILLVRRRESAESEYERVGIGRVQQRYLSRQYFNVRIV
jgi:hypothetical protein